MLQLNDLEAELTRLTAEIEEIQTGAVHPDPRELARAEMDALRPPTLITTAETAAKYRYVLGFGGGKVKTRPEKTPYVAGIHAALDDPSKRFILVKGPARSGKTLAAEDYLLKIGKFGPPRGVLWYMHSEPDLKRYVEERVDFFLREHALEEKISKRGGRSSWNLKRLEGMPWEWLPANPSTTRARSAAFVVADEIDAMRPAVGNAIVTLIRNRQREYGSLAKAYIASHPDRGPSAGIDKLLEDSDLRLRYWTCPDCAHLISPCVEAGKERRVTWNVPALLDQVGETLDRDEILSFVEQNVHLSCPFCQCVIGEDARLELDAAGVWIGKGQVIDQHENVDGRLVENDSAGFVIHAFMAPFVTLAGLAKEWAGAYITFRETGSDDLLKEVNVKSLGETHVDPDDPSAANRDWKETKAAHLDTGYVLGTVPRGVEFLTMMIDVQGNRFEGGVFGWNRYRESWLIDRFSMKQRMGLQDINPGDNLKDWDVLETALGFTYPLNDGSGRHLGIAKMAVDTGGVPGVTNNAYIWASNMLALGKTEAWRLMLSKGDRNLKGDLYGQTTKITHDAANRELPLPILLRVVAVSNVKRVVSRRLDIEQPGPGFIHLPKDIEDRHVKELVAETFTNGVWLRRGANETWDILIMCEVCRALLAPENVVIDWDKDPPPFAVPFIPSQKDRDGDNRPTEEDFFDRLARLNRGSKE